MSKKDVNDLEDDYNFSRKTYYDLISVATDMIPKLAELCDASEHPRAFEVLFKAIKDTADANDKFLELQRRKQVIDNQNGEMHQSVIPEGEEQAAITFNGTTDDLLTALEKMQREKDDSLIEDAEYTEVKNDQVEDDPEGEVRTESDSGSESA